MGYKQVSPIPIIEGGTNSIGFPNPFGIAYFDGTQLNNIIPGTAGQLLQSQGGSPADWVDPSAIGAVITVDADSGSASPSSGVLNIVGGTGVTTSATGSTVTITSSGGGLTWNDQTSSTVTMAVNNGYVMDSASLITATLPSTAAFGTMISISGKGAGLWTIAQNSGQTIHFGAVDTTTGAGGSLSSSGRYDQVSLLCVTANTDFVVTYALGNLQYV